MLKLVLKILILIFFCNCFTVNREYVYGKSVYTNPENNFESDSEQFTSGTPNIIIDSLGHYIFSLPAKLLLWNWKFSDHRISDESKNILTEYIKKNNLNDVKVRFNEYAPIDDFVRLYKNDKVNPLLKYTFGTFFLLIKTFFPERLFAGFGILFFGVGDHYDPYTNTVNVYSNSVPIILHEGGHAKDFQTTVHPTTYTLFRILPFVSLYQEGVASQDAIIYMRENCLVKQEQDSYRELPPAYSTYLASSSGVNVVFFAFPGHMVSIDLREKFRKTEIPKCGKVFGKIVK